MRLMWTKQALEGFRNIRSRYYSPSETAEYKKRLLQSIERKISLLGISIPTQEEVWKGSYKIIIDQYIVYYSFSKNQKVCYIEYFIHSSQNK